MEDYKPNSHKYKEEQKAAELKEKKVSKVVEGTAKTKKRNGLQKFTDNFISEDAQNIKTYILMDVLIPTVKKAISDIVKNGIDMILYDGNERSKKGSATKVSYGKYYDREPSRPQERRNYRAHGYDYDDVIFETRGDAEAVLASMDDIIDRYGVVSVGDLYDLADISTDNYAANKYGWTDISSARAVRVNNGYILKLPRALPLD